MTLDFPPNESDPNEPEVGDLFPPTGTPLWEFTGNGWKRLGGGSGSLPPEATEEEAGEGTETALRSWSPSRLWLAAINAWYGLVDAPSARSALGIGAAATFGVGTTDRGLAIGDDPRFGDYAVQLAVASNAATIDCTSFGSQGGSRRVFLLTINSTAAFTLNITNFPSGDFISDLDGETVKGKAWWEATVIITATQVPSSFTFAGTATKCDVPGSTLTDSPFAAGRVTVLKLLKVAENRYTAKFDPAVTVT